MGGLRLQSMVETLPPGTSTSRSQPQAQLRQVLAVILRPPDRLDIGPRARVPREPH